MSLRLRSVTVLLGVSAALFGGAAASAREPVATAAGCSVGKGTGYGYTYLTALAVHGVSCSTGKNLVKHKGKVSGWSCKKKRLATSPTQYQDRETCTRGSHSVKWTFSENTP